MSFIDKARAKVGDLVDKNGDKVAAGLDKAAGVVKHRTKGKYDDKIDSGTRKAKDALDGLDGKNDDIRDANRDVDPDVKRDPYRNDGLQ